ncbi:IS256 family transposase [bacterium]|nr:IS256 family transposase [bacterium]
MERIQPSEVLVKEFTEDRRGKKLSLSEVVLRSAQMMLQRAIEEEVQEFLGRGYYKRSESEEFRGYRNGYEPKKILTGEGTIELKVPQVRQSRDRFRSAFLEAYTRRTEKLDELILKIAVRGLSVRDIEETMLEILSGEGISRTVISRISDQLHTDFEAWRKRDLTKEKILYLFLDGAYWRVRRGVPSKEAVLTAYGIREDGKKVLLHLSLGNKENCDSWLAFLHDMTERGLVEPVMIVSDGNPGVIKACREVFPDSLKQRCQVHKMRNILARLPKAAMSEMKPMIQKIFTAESYQAAMAAGARLIRRFKDKFPAAMESFEKDLESTLQCLKLPAEHRVRVRTTNLLERLFAEAKRRTKVIPYFQSEKSCLKYVFATLIASSRLWRGVQMNLKIQKQLISLKEGIVKDSKVA